MKTSDLNLSTLPCLTRLTTSLICVLALLTRTR